jgi:hypothetical protein
VLLRHLLQLELLRGGLLAAELVAPPGLLLLLLELLR